MSYLALARKYRPKSFSEMVGQESVLKALVNALDSGNVHHAYLFSGTRGVGKTTIARIFAKCLNNPAGISSNPDLNSDIAKEIDSGSFVDLIEVDAASRTKVDQTRELLENMYYPPSRGRYRVYLIDEIHMLSTHSFNALLKTLEEPPEHVKFLLATTDPQKIPITIISRCLEFNLKKIPQQVIAKQLEKVLSQEGVSYEEGGVNLLARTGKGSLRDTLSVTDQAIAFTNSSLTEKEVGTFLGITDREKLQNLIKAIVSGNAKDTLIATEELARFSPDFRLLLDDILLIFQKAAIIQQVPDYILSEDTNINLVRHIVEKLTAETIQLYYQFLLRGKKELDIVEDDKSGIEMIFLRMLVFSPIKNTDTFINLSNTQKNEQTATEAPREVREAIKQEEVPPTPTRMSNGLQTNDEWISLYNALPLEGFPKQIIGNAELIRATDSSLTFGISKAQLYLLKPDYKKAIKSAFLQILKKESLSVNYKEQETEPTNSPEFLKKQQKQLGEQEAESNLKEDPAIGALIEQFGAKIVDTKVIDS